MNKFTAIHKGSNVECEIIATFNFRQKVYAYYTADYKTMHVAIVDNGNLVEITNPNEYTFVETIYNKLKYEPEFKTNFIEYGPIFYNDQEYKTIFDMKEKRRYFFELVNDKYQEVTGELKNYFDDIYNKEIEIMCLGENENKNDKLSKITKKVVKVGKVAITVIIIGNLAFTPLKTIDLNKGFMQNVTQIMEIYKVDENDAKTIMSYISNNDRLAQEDKEFLMSLRHFFVENESYFDMANAKKNLMNLRINYEKDNQQAHGMNERVRGYYMKMMDRITIFYSDKMDNDIMTKRVVFHEVMHAVSNNGYVSQGNLGLALTEGINELMAEEYLNTYSDIYNKGQTYARIMCELTGHDTVRESFFKNDINLLIKDLVSICGNEKDAMKFISLLDDEAKHETTILLNEDPQKVRDAKETLRRITPVIDTYIRIYYESKFKRPIEEDKLMLAYMDSLRLTNNLENEFYQEGNMEKINVVKHYFNTEIYNKDKGVTVEYIYKNEMQKNLYKYDIEYTSEGKYRRNFQNGKYIEYNENPNIVSYNSATYAYEDRFEEKGRTL
jgi:hypothetical protein